MTVFLKKKKKKRYCTCFVGPRLKAIFRCLALSPIFLRSLFSIFAVSSGSETIENKEVSLASKLSFSFTLFA